MADHEAAPSSERPGRRHHHHHHDHGSADGRSRRVLWIALGLNASLLVVQLVAGLLLDSLAVLADSAHQASDVVALGVALLALSLMRRPGSARHTYGLRRAEALGAQGNAVLLLVAATVVFVEAVPRIADPAPIDGAGVAAIAVLGLVVNLGSALLLARAGSRDLNQRAAIVHLASDAGGSLAVLAAGVAAWTLDATWVDPAASILIGLLVVVGAWRLLRDTTHVLLEGAPRDLDLEALEAALVAEPSVAAVHHLHVWELGSDLPALSVHVVLDGEPTLHDAQQRADGLKRMLAERFGIEHATLELECHECDVPVHAPRS